MQSPITRRLRLIILTAAIGLSFSNALYSEETASPNSNGESSSVLKIKETSPTPITSPLEEPSLTESLPAKKAQDDHSAKRVSTASPAKPIIVTPIKQKAKGDVPPDVLTQTEPSGPAWTADMRAGDEPSRTASRLQQAAGTNGSTHVADRNSAVTETKKSGVSSATIKIVAKEKVIAPGEEEKPSEGAPATLADPEFATSSSSANSTSSSASSSTSGSTAKVSVPSTSTTATSRKGTTIASPKAMTLAEQAKARESQVPARYQAEEAARASSKTAAAGEEPVAESRAADSEEMKPVPDAEEAGPQPIEAASFKGVTPGITSIDEVESLWGAAKELSKQDDLITQLFSVEPFDRVEVSYQNDKVASILVRFNQPLPADKIAQQLGMAAIRPVLVSNDMGDILGQVYPERGVLLGFAASEEKGQPSLKVTHIILEPINAEPFVLRAESSMERYYDRSLQDLNTAIKLQAENDRAHWLMSRILAATDQLDKADASSAQAVKLQPKNPRYHVTRAQILGQLGRLTEAQDEAQQAINVGTSAPHVQSRAYCILADLTASGTSADYKKALSLHMQALKIANTLVEDPHPAVRTAAKEALVDAHLGAAHDIAWGDWKEKEKSVNRWLEKANKFATDLVDNEGCSIEQLFRVHARALAACVGLRGSLDPEPWIKEALISGDKMIDSTNDPSRKAQFQWDLGMALYDAVQTYQLRDEHAKATQYGELAAEYLAQGYEQRQTPDSAYLLGRLYFRLGAVYAIRDGNHRKAITWFEKAIPLLQQPMPAELGIDWGRHGETFVSMGVSFWEVGQNEKAINLTQFGIDLMEKAVKKGMLDSASLAVAYGNLSSMHRRLGDTEEANRYQQMALRVKQTTRLK